MTLMLFIKIKERIIMKKKIKDLTLKEIRNICSNNVNGCNNCPLFNFKDKLCLIQPDLHSMFIGNLLEKEVEVDE